MKKITGNRGVSILIALFIFLLAALTGTAVLTMSTSNAGRFTHAREDQQRYLSIESAVRLIREELGAFTAVVTVGRVPKETRSATDSVSEVDHKGSALFGSMSVLLDQGKAKTVAERDGVGAVAMPAGATVEFTLKVETDSGEDLTERIGEVDVTLRLDDKLNMVFEVGHSGEGSNYRTRMTVRHIDALGQHSPEESGAATYEKTFRWDAEHAQIELVGTREATA